MSIVSPSSFTNFDGSIFLSSISIKWLTVVLFKIINWIFQGFAIIWLSMNHFKTIFRSQ